MAGEELLDSTICARAGSLCTGNSSNAFSAKALWQSSVYEFDSLEELASARYVYRRYGSPNSDELAKAVALLEAAEQGLATSSGMGAIVAAILSFCKAGDRILAQFDCYGITREFFEVDAPRFGIRTQFLDVHNVQTLELSLKNILTANEQTTTAEPRNNNTVVFLESITNPSVRVADLPSISTVCKKYGAFLIVDNTFATPIRIKPIKQGADMVIHSVTKFLGGHSDLVAGVVAGSSHHIELASKLVGRWGLLAAPFDSWLATRGIRTLQVRMERALSTTAELARRIIRSSIPVMIKWSSDCAIMAIEVPGGFDGANKAVSCFKMIKFAPSLGGTTTTVSHPASTSHRTVPYAEREAMGITDGMLRLSMGLEDVEDIWSDIERGLAAAVTANKPYEQTFNFYKLKEAEFATAISSKHRLWVHLLLKEMLRVLQTPARDSLEPLSCSHSMVGKSFSSKFKETFHLLVLSLTSMVLKDIFPVNSSNVSRMCPEFEFLSY